MQIGLVIYGSLETTSGGYLYDRMLVNYLRSKGDQVEIISIPWRSYLSHLVDNFSRHLLIRLTGNAFDILLQDELNHPSLFWLNRRLRERVDFPIISIVHHLRCNERRPPWQNYFYRIIERAYLSSVNGNIFNSQATQKAVTELLGNAVSTEPLSSIIAPPGGDRFGANISEQEISTRAHQPGSLKLLFIGNLIPRKGLHTLLSALAKLPRNTFQLTVVGDDTVDKKYSALIRHSLINLDLQDHVNLSGSLPDAALRSILKSSHLLVVPSEYEGFGIVYLEGMGFGLPAIATIRGGAGEIVNDQIDGYLLQPGDVETLASLIQRLDEDRALLEKLSLEAYRRYNIYPKWDETCALIRDFLQKVARNQN